MTATDTAARLIRAHGCTAAADTVADKVRRWATWSNGGRRAWAVRRMRFWLAVDWQIHHNPAQPC